MKPQNVAELKLILQTDDMGKSAETIRALSKAFSNDWVHA